MRERSLLYLFLALNGLLAGAFAIYLFLSTHRQPKIVAGSLPVATNKTTKVTNAVAKPVVAATPVAAPTNAPAVPVAVTPTPAAKFFGWQDVETPEYLKYIGNLRLVGCPDDKIRQIIVSDINQLID